MIDAITSVFAIRQNRLAQMMFCDKSKISRIRSGAEVPALKNEEIFTNVFDPANPTSAAKSFGKPEYCLDLLKEVIESDFKEIFEVMSDCWSEKEYKKFVLILLSRARKGPATKIKSQLSDDCDKSSTSSPMPTDEDFHKKQERASSGKTPPEQMREIFEQAVADYGIATYICKLPDYLIEEPFYASDIFAFTDFIQANVLAKFVNHQNENIFGKISEFNLALNTYSGFLSMIRLSVSEKYGIMLKMTGFNNELISLIDRDYDEMKTNLSREMPMEERATDRPSMEEMEGDLTQLEFLRSILLSHKHLCELFGEICPGKRILIF